MKDINALNWISHSSYVNRFGGMIRDYSSLRNAIMDSIQRVDGVEERQDATSIGLRLSNAIKVIDPAEIEIAAGYCRRWRSSLC